MSLITENNRSATIKAIVFDRWTVERAEKSPLIAIHDSLKRRGGFDVKYFDPSAFDPDRREWPTILKGDKTGQQYMPNVVFTYGFNFFDVQDYYSQPFFDNEKRSYRADVVTVDHGFLRRDQGYRYVVKNGELPKASSNARFKALGLKFESRRKPDGHILFCEQNHHKDWQNAALGSLVECKNPVREIRTRKPNSKTPLQEDIEGAYAIVSYNSTCLYEGLLAGLKVFCAPECPASAVGVTDVSKIESEDEPTSQQKAQAFMNKLSYAQWRLDELRMGIWTEHYFTI